MSLNIPAKPSDISTILNTLEAQGSKSDDDALLKQLHLLTRTTKASELGALLSENAINIISKIAFVKGKPTLRRRAALRCLNNILVLQPTLRRYFTEKGHVLSVIDLLAEGDEEDELPCASLMMFSLVGTGLDLGPQLEKGKLVNAISKAVTRHARTSNVPTADPSSPGSAILKLLSTLALMYEKQVDKFSPTTSPLFDLLTKVAIPKDDPLQPPVTLLINCLFAIPLPNNYTYSKESVARLIELLELGLAAYEKDNTKTTLNIYFELAERSPQAFVTVVGFGNAAGFLASKGIKMSESEINQNNNGPSYAINPITGQRLDMEDVSDLPEMTDEEKEREAERLFVLFERLRGTGVVDIENPVTKAKQEGRFEELPDDYEEDEDTKKQSYATDASKKKTKKRYIIPTAVSTPPRRDPYMFPKAREWATAVGIGTPVSLRPFKLVLPPHLRGVGFAPKYSPLPTIRSTDMPVYFSALEHPMSAYHMLKYERKLATHSLFLYVHVGVTAQPVVRNYVERWVRDAIWAAMQEKGYSNTGRVLPEGEMPPGVTPPNQDMCGTLLVKITNPSKIVTLKRSQSLEIGRHVVQTVLRELAAQAHPNRLLQPVQFPADFLPHYKKKALLAQIEKEWEEESKGMPRVKSVEEKLADAIADKENFYTISKYSLSSLNMLVSLTVGKVDAGVTVLLTPDKRLIEFPSILLPPGISSGSIVDITVSRNTGSESASDKAFQSLQDRIYGCFGASEPTTPVLRCRNATQTSVVLEWDPIHLATAELVSLSLYRNGQKAGNIPRPLEMHSTKISGLAVDTAYTFHLVLRTTAGTYSSEQVTVRTHKMTDLSGITITAGAMPPNFREALTAAVERIGAKLVDSVRIDTTHFVTTEGRGVAWEKAVENNIPVVRPEWVEACERSGRILGVTKFYLDAVRTGPPMGSTPPAATQQHTQSNRSSVGPASTSGVSASASPAPRSSQKPLPQEPSSENKDTTTAADAATPAEANSDSGRDEERDKPTVVVIFAAKSGGETGTDD
ncbi:Cell fusion protein cfr1 [Ceratocystis platani]|uniref:Cell fusion protein cfr1 n=1 Tax=Ceratocystis fimbriata f. sp. platani TaxID=88771 RepID=A0A0F8B3D6_CERFI|nr:Cell fusion protein cfr1 [Ceratocystis platani]